jgi:anti-sigma factor ChrR (cupin superfamily)
VTNSKAGKPRSREVPLHVRFNSDYVAGRKNGWIKKRQKKAGTVYPAHRHAGIEESYLIEGDLLVEGYTLRSGDYCRAEAGSFHGEVRTDKGCKFIAVASLEDELLPR